MRKVSLVRLVECLGSSVLSGRMVLQQRLFPHSLLKVEIKKKKVWFIETRRHKLEIGTVRFILFLLYVLDQQSLG